jgi:ATP-dependent DNA ligase
MIITPQLARPWSQWRNTFPCDAQYKFDGIRCLVNRGVGYSRLGNPFFTIRHVHRALDETARMYPALIWDGELYSHTLHDDFNKIVSLVKKQNPTDTELGECARVLEYHIFDVYNPSAPQWSWSARRDFLRNLPIAWSFGSPIKIVETHTLHDEQSLDRLYEMALLDHYEGLILRLDGPYICCGGTNRRSAHMYKKKPSTTVEYPIVEVLEGEGKCRGMAGSIRLRTKAGRTFEASCKMDFLTRLNLFRDRGAVIGKLATVRFQNLTPDEIPRFGRVESIRDYE